MDGLGAIMLGNEPALKIYMKENHAVEMKVLSARVWVFKFWLWACGLQL